MKRFLRQIQALSIEPRALLALGTLAGLTLFFVGLSEDVLTGETHAFDRAVLLALRVHGDLSQPIGPAWVSGMFRDITALGSTTVITLVTAISVSYLFVARQRLTGLLVLLSISCGAILEKSLKIAFHRARPEIVPHLVDVHTLSFPSGHAMLSAVAYLTLAVLLARAQRERRIRLFMLGTGLFLTLAIGVSRVYLGVHWPTDVLAGWTAGSIWVLGVWLVGRWLKLRARKHLPSRRDCGP